MMMNKPTPNLSLGIHPPKSEIRNPQSDTPQPTSATPHLQSEIRNPTSDTPQSPSAIRHPTSAIRAPTSEIHHPSPHIRNPKSEIRHPPSFVHLHVHSHYSMMWGVSSVTALCKKAAEAGCEYLALTDTNGLYGLIHFLEVARQYGIRPIVGAHLQVNCHNVSGARQAIPPSRTHHSLLISFSWPKPHGVMSSSPTCSPNATSMRIFPYFATSPTHRKTLRCSAPTRTSSGRCAPVPSAGLKSFPDPLVARH